MNPDGEETVSGQLNTLDRFSDLPDFIIHHIISFLNTREAYRSCILSKRWADVLATNPIIEFHYYYAPKFTLRCWPSKEVSARLLGYIDSRMQRYAKDNLRVRTLRLIFPDSNEVFSCDVDQIELSSKLEEFSCKVDEWIQIAVRNQVARLDLHGPLNYQLPDILLSAKSLRQLNCSQVKIPYYNGAINLASLQTLKLLCVDVEERMLNHIISSSQLLKCLSVNFCYGFKTIVIPCCSQLKELTLSNTLPKGGTTIIIETSSLACFKFSDFTFDRWPVVSKPGLLRNLTVLDIFCSGITDEDLGKLLPELASLETLLLRSCQKLTTIRVLSIRLKVINLDVCGGLVDVMVDAPSLTKFIYGGAVGLCPAITISSQASCDISVRITPIYLDTQGFFRMQKLMTGLRSCHAVEIVLTKFPDQSVCDNIKFNEEELGDVNLGPPRDITELKLTLYYLKLSRSSVSAFLNGIFWTCRPDTISFGFRLEDPGLMIQFFMSELEDMANCLRHPLKRIEFPDANCSNIHDSEKVEVQWRLHW